jgi:UDP-3-O-[3-hydroxymyristoyl] glucosamine N-acyltransferase
VSDFFTFAAMEFSAGQIADLLNGRVDGDPDVKIYNLSKIEEGESGTMTFLANPKYTQFIYSTKASIAIVNESFEAEHSLPETLTLIRVADAYASFAQLLKIYEEMISSPAGTHESAIIDPSATVHESASIGAGCIVGQGATIESGATLQGHCFVGPGASIGANSVLHPGVKVLARCEIGSDCTLHSGAVIGSDGFGFAPNSENNYQKVPQIGNVILEDHVEIGANTTIDRATLGTTRICRGVKLDNLIQIAHNVEIGENTVIASQTGIAGSTKIGKNCMIGGQVGIIGHLKIADEVKIAAQSGIGSSIEEPGTIVQGSPAFGIGAYKKSYVGFRKLPEILRELSEIKKKLESRS